MEHHVIDEYAIGITELRTPGGVALPVITIDFMTRTDADQPQPYRWPQLRLRPEQAQELIERLAAMLLQAQTQNYTGPIRYQ